MFSYVKDLGIDVLFKGHNFLRLMGGLLVTLKISLISIAISVALGLAFGILMQKKNIAVRVVSRIYIDFIRTMPQLVLLFIVYFGSTRVFRINLTGELSAIIVFSLWGIAEMGEIVRGSLSSVSNHQYESAEALGLSRLQTFIYVILPQSLRRIIPISINLITRMIKTTSLVLMIGVVEMIKVAQQIIEANRMLSKNAAFGVYLVVFILYFLICWPISVLSMKLEKRWKQC